MGITAPGLTPHSNPPKAKDMRELSEDYGEPDREPSRLGCMIGAAICGLSAMIVAALLAWAGYQGFKWATDPKRYVSVSEPLDALWAKKREEA